MYAFKKCIAAFILPPGSFILLFTLMGGLLWHRKQRVYAIAILLLSFSLWMLSIYPISWMLTRQVEAGLTIPARLQGDVIILLGGGAHGDVPDLTGTGTPSSVMMGRIITAVRLQRRLDVPIIISEGSVSDEMAAEPLIVQRFLIDLGVPAQQILFEGKSRDTAENAIYCRDIINQRHFHKPLLVTSAIHMRRAIGAFNRVGVSVTPVPAQFTGTPTQTFYWPHYLPNADALSASSQALSEQFGILYYRLCNRLHSS